MTTLSPTGGARRRGGLLPFALVAVVALAVGLTAGWWFSGGPGGDTAQPTTTPTLSCPPSGVTPAPLPAPKAITVNVYNATDRAGLARTTATDLAKRGFRVGRVANDPKDAAVAVSAEVRHGPKGAAQAKVVAAQVRGATLVADTRADATVDLALGAAFVGLATPAEAAAALAPPPVPSGC
jgi:hypothetical protein